MSCAGAERFTPSELERLALDELRADARRHLHNRSLKQAQWNDVRAEAGAAGLQLDEMSALQLRRLITALEVIPRWRQEPSAPTPAKKKAEPVGKAFGWAQR